MDKFTLTKRDNFPTSVKINGVNLAVNPDFRVLMRISKLVDDVEVEENVKIIAMLQWFYASDVSRFAPHELVTELRRFISMGEEKEREDTSEDVMCFEFDAEEIYSDFLTQYGIDLVEIEFLHFYKFLILLRGLSSDSALKKKIEFRTMDIKDIQKRNDPELMQAYKDVQIPIKYTEEELEFIRTMEGG